MLLEKDVSYLIFCNKRAKGDDPSTFGLEDRCSTNVSYTRKAVEDLHSLRVSSSQARNLQHTFLHTDKGSIRHNEYYVKSPPSDSNR